MSLLLSGFALGLFFLTSFSAISVAFDSHKLTILSFVAHHICGLRSLCLVSFSPGLLSQSHRSLPISLLVPSPTLSSPNPLHPSHSLLLLPFILLPRYSTHTLPSPSIPPPFPSSIHSFRRRRILVDGLERRKITSIRSGVEEDE